MLQSEDLNMWTVYPEKYLPPSQIWSVEDLRAEFAKYRSSGNPLWPVLCQVLGDEVIKLGRLDATGVQELVNEEFRAVGVDIQSPVNWTDAAAARAVILLAVTLVALILLL